MYYTYVYAIQVCTAGPSYCVYLERKLRHTGMWRNCTSY